MVNIRALRIRWKQSKQLKEINVLESLRDDKSDLLAPHEIEYLNREIDRRYKILFSGI